MNIDIYNDLAWQFKAYRNGGLSVIQTAYKYGNSGLDSFATNAWGEIDQGIQQANLSTVQNGNQQLAYREQFTILQPDYNVLSNSISIAPILISALAKNPVPTGTNFNAVVPGGNICIFSDRWKWVTNSIGIWPPWISASPANQSQWANIPLLVRAANYAITTPLY